MAVFNFFKIKSFLLKDYLIESSYKLNFVLTFVNSTFPIISIYFLGRLISSPHTISLEKYGGKYFPFALIGVAFTRFFQLAVDTFSGNIKRAQMAGCLEAILSAKTGAKTVVLLSSLYSFLSAGVQLFFMFFLGLVFFDFDLSNTNFPATVLILFSSMITFISLGVLSAAGTVVFKQGEPIGWLFGILSALLGGAMFPVSIMPLWLQWFAKVFPITYTLDALRLATLRNYSILQLREQLLILTSMAIILFPVSLKIFEWTIEKGKREGTLIQY